MGGKDKGQGGDKVLLQQDCTGVTYFNAVPVAGVVLGRRVKVERPNVPLPYTEVLIQPFGPNGLSQLLNYDIIGFPEEGNQIELPSLKCRRGRMVSTPEQETIQLETANVDQGHISPLYPHSTVQPSISVK